MKVFVANTKMMMLLLQHHQLMLHSIGHLWAVVKQNFLFFEGSLMSEKNSVLPFVIDKELLDSFEDCSSIVLFEVP